MGNTPLSVFIDKVRASRRLLYGDLQRLQRDVLPGGFTSRADAEAVLALAGSIDRADPGWSAYLVGTLSAFVLSTSQPRGSVDRETADWLVLALADLPQKTSLAVVRSVVLGAETVDDVLLYFLGRSAKPRPALSAAVACRRIRDERVTGDVEESTPRAPTT